MRSKMKKKNGHRTVTGQFSIPPPSWKNEGYLGKGHNILRQDVNTALEMPVACNFFWLSQQKTYASQLRCITCSWCVVIYFLLLYRGYISKAALNWNKIEEAHTASYCWEENFMRSKWSANCNLMGVGGLS